MEEDNPLKKAINKSPAVYIFSGVILIDASILVSKTFKGTNMEVISLITMAAAGGLIIGMGLHMMDIKR